MQVSKACLGCLHSHLGSLYQLLICAHSRLLIWPLGASSLTALAALMSHDPRPVAFFPAATFSLFFLVLSCRLRCYVCSERLLSFLPSLLLLNSHPSQLSPHLQTLHLPRSHLLGTKLPTKCLQLSLPSHSSSSTSSKTHQLRSPDKCPNCCSSPQSPSSTAEARPTHLTFLALEQAARRGLALPSSPTALLQG